MAAAIRLKHISRFRDRHGHLRHYLRLPGRKAVALPGEPGSPDFMRAYHAAIDAAAQPASLGRAPAPGSFGALAVSYYGSEAFRGLRDSTQAAYRRIVEEIRRHGEALPLRRLDAEGVRAIVAAKRQITAANHRLRLLRALMRHALAVRMIAADPTIGIARRAYRTDGYATWSEAEIAQYEARWPAGSRQRLALYLLLYTGQRRSDVVRMGRQHRGPDGLDVRQVKTGRRLRIPIHSALAAELALLPEDRLTYLLTEYGQPFTPRGFYNAFRAWCDDAGIPQGRSPHGLRKACGRRLAEGGCTEHQIMAILGVTPATAAIYTRAAAQDRLARDGMAKLEPIRLPTRLPTRGGKIGKTSA